MECPFCHQDPEIIVPVPDPNGGGEILTCLDCAIEEGLYCRTHDVKHTEFVQGGHACLGCIEADVQKRAHEAEQIVAPLYEMSPECTERIQEWAEIPDFIMGDSQEAISLLRAVMVYSHLWKVPPEEVVVRIAAKKDIDTLLPFPF